MQVTRPVGREAASKKYDILSAMMAYALAGDQHRQKLVLRMMALITTRYNWQRNDLEIGQREIARLWCVDERTVKRDMARLKGQGWLIVKRQGARGRVSVLGLDLDRIMLDTRPSWANIGEDYVTRLGGEPGSATDPKVVPFRRPDNAAGQGGLWGRICLALEAEDPSLFQAWFAGLTEIGLEDGCLTLLAPSRFHATYLRTHLMTRLRVAARRVEGSVVSVRVEAI